MNCIEKNQENRENNFFLPLLVNVKEDFNASSLTPDHIFKPVKSGKPNFFLSTLPPSLPSIQQKDLFMTSSLPYTENIKVIDYPDTPYSLVKDKQKSRLRNISKPQ